MSDSQPVERKLVTSDGTALHVEQHEPDRPRAAVVLIHGFAVHCGRYRNVSAAFAQRGFAVTAFDCRGHGRSTGPRGFVRRFADFVDDLRMVIALVRERFGAVPLVVVGHSHGGTIALRHALADPGSLSALVLAAPWLKLKVAVPGWKMALSNVADVVWPGLALSNELRPEDTTRDAAIRAAWADDPLTHHLATPRWFNEVRRAQNHIRDNAATLRVPTLMALPGDDRVVCGDTAVAFAAAAGPIVEVKHYPEAFHELFLEPNWRDIVEDVASWVVARVSTPYTFDIG